MQHAKKSTVLDNLVTLSYDMLYLYTDSYPFIPPENPLGNSNSKLQRSGIA